MNDKDIVQAQRHLAFQIGEATAEAIRRDLTLQNIVGVIIACAITYTKEFPQFRGDWKEIYMCMTKEMMDFCEKQGAHIEWVHKN